MVINLWFFLTVTIVFSVLLIIVLANLVSKRKVKELELEALKVKHLNLQEEVEAAVSRHMKEQMHRIQVLEAIVTDNKYELNQNITALKKS